MSNSTTLLDLISSTQANKEAVANALFDAASPATLWGRRSSTTTGLTWGYYGGTYYLAGVANAVASGTLALTASATNYVYASATTGAVGVNTSGFPAGSIPLYSIVAGTTTVTSYTDMRSYQPSAAASTAAVVGMSLAGGAVQTSAYTWATSDKGQCLVMNDGSAVSQPLPTPTGSTGNFPSGWWGAVENIGSGVMTLTVPSGVSLDGVANGTLVLAQGTGVHFFTDGTNWFTIRGASSGGGGSSTLAGLSDVNVTEGAAIDGFSLVFNNATGKWIAELVSGGSSGQTSPQFHGASYTSNAFSMVKSTSTYPSLATATYDVDGWWSATNPTRLTVPAGLGFKKVNLFAELDTTGWITASNGCQLFFRKNGSTNTNLECAAPGFSTNAQFQAVAMGVPVSDGDYFEVGYFQGDNTGSASVKFAIQVCDLGPQTYAPPATANMDIVGYMAGAVGASQILVNAVTPQPLTLPNGLAGSYAYCGVAPTAAVSCAINLITAAGVTTAIGSVNFAAGATTGTFTFANAVTTNPGDTFQIRAPSSADATFSGPRFGIAGTTPASNGGVNAQTGTTYTLGTSDRNGLVTMNNASANTVTAPAATGSTGNYPNGWRCYIENLGAGATTLAVPSGAYLDGALNGTLTLASKQAAMVWTDGVNWFTIRGSGGSSSSSLVAVQAHNATAQSIPSGTLTVMTGWTADQDNSGGAWNGTTGVFTAPVAGWYVVSMGAQFANTTYAVNNAIIAAIEHNGVQIASARFSVQIAAMALTAGANVAEVVYCAAGDTISPACFQNSGAALGLSGAGAYNFFSISQISAGSATALSNLNDVGITSPVDGQTLVYVGAAAKWENTAPADLGGFIDGNFDSWQVGTTFTLPAATPTYTADMWVSNAGTGGAATVSQNTPALGSEPSYLTRPRKFRLAHAQTTAATSNPTLGQRLEGVNQYSGQNITVQASLAALAAGTLVVGLQVTQNFGTGGSPSTSVVTSQALAWPVTTTEQKFSAQIAVPSVAGKTLGTNGNDYVQVDLLLATGATYTLYASQLQIDVTPNTANADTTGKGGIPLAFRYRGIGLEMERVGRYYENSYTGSAPGTAVTSVFVSILYTITQAMPVRWAVVKRAAPTLTTYSPQTGASGKYYYTGSPAGDVTAGTPSGLTRYGFVPTLASGQTVGQGVYFHYTADARL